MRYKYLFLILPVILIYQLIFSYSLFSTDKFGTVKHKMYNVFYFPNTVFNPFKVKKIKSLILEYVSSEKFQSDIVEFEKKHPKSIFNASYLNNIKFNENNIELISIKKNINRYDILTSKTNQNSGTIVFIMYKNKIVGFY